MTAPMSSLEALLWCKEVGATVEWRCPRPRALHGPMVTVTVEQSNATWASANAPTFLEAVVACRERFELRVAP